MMDEATFKTFYESTARQLLAYLVRVAGEKALADDTFQEAYVRMLHADLKEVGQPQWKSYLFATATNLLRDHWRKSTNKAQWDSDTEKDLGSDNHEDRIDLEYALEVAFEGLSPQQRSLLWLAYVEGYAHKEIASALELKEKSVRVLLFRARKKLAGILHSMGMRKEK